MLPLEPKRDGQGMFAAKSDQPRDTRTIRVTKQTWDDFGEWATKRRVTRADLLEELVEEWKSTACYTADPENLTMIAQLLEEALTLKANAGGAIKEKIREALRYLYLSA